MRMKVMGATGPPTEPRRLGQRRGPVRRLPFGPASTRETKAHDHWSSALPRGRDGIGTSATQAFRPLPDGTHALPWSQLQIEPPN